MIEATFENFKKYFPNIEVKRTDGTEVTMETVCLMTVEQPDIKTISWIVTLWEEWPEELM